jgi:hypothetical protein
VRAPCEQHRLPALLTHTNGEASQKIMAELGSDRAQRSPGTLTVVKNGAGAIKSRATVPLRGLGPSAYLHAKHLNSIIGIEMPKGPGGVLLRDPSIHCKQHHDLILFFVLIHFFLDQEYSLAKMVKQDRPYAKRTLVSFTVQHRGVVVMWGDNMQRHMEHAVECKSPMRLAVALLRVVQDTAPEEHPDQCYTKFNPCQNCLALRCPGAEGCCPYICKTQRHEQ